MTTALGGGLLRMARIRSGRSIVVEMNTTATDPRPSAREPHVLVVDGIRRRQATVLHAAPAPARPARVSHRDDGSHTPPHGDAVLPRRRPA